MSMDNLRRLINQIVDCRVNKNISQKNFADKLQIKKSNLNRIEKGRENISFDMILKMIRELEYDVKLRIETGDKDDHIYVLKQFDFPILSFELLQNEFKEYVCHIISVNENNKSFLPIDLKATDESLLSFLKKRTIPKHRTYIEQILKANDLEINDLKGILDLCMGLSLNDCYWVTKSSFKGKFQDYNLYENDFSTALSTVAFTGDVSSKIILTTSPEFTTLGMLPKAWRKVNNNILLYKGSTSGASNLGNEAYIEFFCSQILDQMSINHVSYHLDKWKGHICSTCPLFTSIDESYISIGRIIKTGGIKEVIKYYEELGEEYINNLYSMFVFDSLVFNEDRHLGNFGLIINSKTNKISGPAPIFDNGNSLFHYAALKDYQDLDKYAQSRMYHNPYDISFDEIAKYCLKDKQIKQLQKLINFKLTNDINYPYPQYKIDALNDFIQQRVNYLLSMI